MPSNSTKLGSNLSQWPEILMAALIGTLAIYLAWPQIFPGSEQSNEANLANLQKRATILSQISDPIQRDSMCIGLSAYGRQLDLHISKDARIFISGMVGQENGGHLGIYYFLRNYLFPRELDVSIDRKAIFTEHGFDGVLPNSIDELRTNNFDLLLNLETNGNISLQPLTEKGVPK
jgi:hypothetical protein